MHEIPLPPPKPKANPGQIRAYDTADDRLEIANLLGHLAPARRLAFLSWVCSQAVLPGTFGLHPRPARSTVLLADEARHCDRASERLTMAVLSDVCHMAIDYSLNLSACLAHLVQMAKGKA